MSANLTALLYLGASVCFIMALKGLSSPETSRGGNLYGIFGMLVAIGTTVAQPDVLGYEWIAVFIGYYVVWRVTPALHSPLMAVTNAISSVIIVGALIAVGVGGDISKIFGFVAVVLASVNIFGGFIVTQRMLLMFKKKK